MSATLLVELEPLASFCAASSGDAGSDARGLLFHSDTLMAALRAVAAETGLEAPLFDTHPPPFVVSSLFFEVAGVRLYPRPRPLPSPFVEAESESAMSQDQWERLSFLSEARLESLAEGRRVRFVPEDVIEGRAWVMPSERSLSALPARGTTRRVAVDRLAGGVERFEREAVELSATTRLFFCVRFESPSLVEPFLALTSALGDSGLGGRRTTGAGRFRVAGSRPAPRFLGSGERAPDASRLLLSLYSPSAEEARAGVLDGVDAAIVERGGWMSAAGTANVMRRSVRMVAEGAVFPARLGAVHGEVRSVAPEGYDLHDVWRDGRAFLIDARSW